MKIIAFGASPSKNSINKKLATYAASLFENAEVEVLDLNDFEMPLFTVDIEPAIGKHPLAQTFLDKIATADILVISLAENNLRKAIELEPNEPEANYWLGKSLFRWDRKPEALKYLKKAVRLGHKKAAALVAETYSPLPEK